MLFQIVEEEEDAESGLLKSQRPKVVHSSVPRTGTAVQNLVSSSKSSVQVRGASRPYFKFSSIYLNTLPCKSLMALLCDNSCLHPLLFLRPLLPGRTHPRF